MTKLEASGRGRLGRGRSGHGLGGRSGHAVSQPRDAAAPAFYARSLSRRALLRSVAGAAWGLALGARGARAASADEELRERITSVIQEYDAQGEHRTGKRADERSAGWLGRELAGRGLRAELEWFPLARFEPSKAQIVSGGQRRFGEAAFDGGTTGPGGVEGRLGRLGTRAEIAIARVAPLAPEAEMAAFEAARRSGRYRALVVLPTAGARHGDLALINAERFAEPGGAPVLQLAGAHTWELEAAAERGERATVTVEGERVPAQAANVIARIAGREPELAPLIVMTPRSGWFTCAAERGGGIAAWLEVAEALAAEPPRRDVVLVASSGHELGHLGLRAFLAKHAELAARTHAWLHLGANFVARGGAVVLQASSAELSGIAQTELAAAGRKPDVIAPPGAPPRGEAREIAERPYVSLLGTNPWFHSPEDRWPEAVDLSQAVALARALVAIARRLGA